eukprot:CAMPEP_0194246802 /NCGR_PEP_ID=MMETSP0158-20130606/15609_1 /TAXON_ID=33649 /ORGANISM="Thalassionema nitzschioides, Strain L26-B" /LENGTH=872 /DNA_ID=CAMNT_0038982795 /DNA_START=81 /DNA_END=2699 /DNA_ORIENTATION=-
MASPSNTASMGTSTPPPPGFSQSMVSSPGGSQHHDLHDTDSLRSRDFSSTPPPGFKSGALSSEGRSKVTQNPIWKDSRLLDTNSYSVGNGIVNTRTTSFSDLAELVGTGLAESMEDSTRDANRMGADGLYGLSYARQFRQAASRMIGSSGSGLSPTANSLDLAAPPSLSRRYGDSSIYKSSPVGTLVRDHDAPSSLYSGEKNSLEDFRESLLRRRKPALGIFSENERSEVAVTVVEPSHSGKSTLSHMLGEVISRQGTPDLTELQRDMQHISMTRTKSPQPTTDPQRNPSNSELGPFLWSVHYAEPSRALAILQATNVPASDIRSKCESFGVLEVFRVDFADRGIFFVGYYDIRSAQYAATELKKALGHISSEGHRIEVKYCVPLNSSSSHDDSVIVISDLPRHIGELDLAEILGSYGSIRSLKEEKGAHYGGKSYVVEFHNVQDAKLALLELESTQPLGPDVMVEVGSRRAVDRKRGREFLSVISRWRHGNRHLQPFQAVVENDLNNGAFNSNDPHEVEMRRRNGNPTSFRRDGSNSPLLPTKDQYSPSRNNSDNNSSTSLPQQPSQQSTQLVLGPDGRYSYVVVDHSALPLHPPPSSYHFDSHIGARAFPRQAPPQQQLFHGPHGTYVTAMPPSPSQVNQSYWNQPNQHHQYHVGGATTMASVSHTGEGNVYSQNTTNGSVPYYSNVGSNHVDSSVSSAGSTSNNLNVVQGTRRVGQAEDKDNRHLTLDVDAVESGRDARTSLMVRNIPNKYTQQMLLSEFTDNGHGPGKIDFFYLPIDFKNKCNRGYVFVNFVDCRDIVQFHRQYFGQHWRVFNSDKICDITYARIQGKTGMLKRFENSALMEKDEEYKPLVFVSHGPEKGSRISFPSS